jgi:hypothetical protein
MSSAASSRTLHPRQRDHRGPSQVHKHADFLRQLSDAVNLAVEGYGTVVYPDLVEQAIIGEGT